MTDRPGSAVPSPSSVAVELGQVLRHLNAAVLDPSLGDHARGALLAGLAPLVDDLPRPSSRYSEAERASFRSGPGGKIDPRGTHPFYGLATGSGAVMSTTVAEDSVVVRARFDVRHEGAPGWVHGGIVATGFDIALGRAVSEFAERGPTGSMSIRFTAPTPVDVEVEFRAWLERREGRKSFVAGDLRVADSDVVCAEADAVFLALG